MGGGTLPDHVAIVMDGNGRWARERELSRIKGHERGAESVRVITEATREKEIPALTLFAFSRENWKRPDEEVSFLMDLLELYLEKEKSTLMDHNIQFRVIGQREDLNQGVRDEINHLEEETRNNSSMVLRLALNYGGKQEVVDAMRDLGKKIQTGTVQPERIDEDDIQKHLYDPEMKDVDLLIRTGGEKRLSNFLLWQITYAEIYFTDVHWPAFRKKAYEKALNAFEERERRFGGLASRES